jgi:hypothetical protein
MPRRGEAMLDFNRDSLAAAPISTAIEEAIERPRPPEVNTRQRCLVDRRRVRAPGPVRLDV